MGVSSTWCGACFQPRTIPASGELVRLYADYLHGESGDLDSDYVFVNLWGKPAGAGADQDRSPVRSAFT